MLSWQALILNGILRFTMKRHGKKSLDMHRLRAATRNPPKMSMNIPRGFTLETRHSADGLKFDVADRSAPPARSSTLIVLYLHGGGYLFGSPQTHRQVLFAMSKAFEAPTYGLYYRLAPENPFPAAVEDAERAYRGLLQEFPSASIVLAGDSAGAGLAIATAIGIRDAGLKRAAAIVGFSPYADLAVSGESVEANARSCAMFTPRGVREAASIYLAGADAKHPRASPVYADLHDLPPMLLFASEHEILRDDTLRLAERAKAAGVSVQLIVRDRLPHVWPIFVTLLPEAREAFATVAAFARGITAGKLS
jgi:epsilon-lactone hydrolase